MGRGQVDEGANAEIYQSENLDSRDFRISVAGVFAAEEGAGFDGVVLWEHGAGGFLNQVMTEIHTAYFPELHPADLTFQP